MRSISKVLVMGAVAGACGYAAAGSITAPGAPASFGLESASAVSSAVSITNLGTAGGAGPAGFATINTGTLNFASNAISASTGRLTITSNRTFGSVDVHAQSFQCSATGVANGSITWQLSSTSSSTSVIYDAASRGAGDISAASCAIPSIAFLASSFATAGDISLGATVVNLNTGFTLDALASTKVASVASAFAFAVSSSLDAVIDVQANRLTFASGADTTLLGAGSYSDNFTITNTHTARSTVGGSFASTFALTLTAGTSFAYLEEPTGATGAGSCSVSLGSGQAASGGSIGQNQTPVVAPTSGACNVMTINFNTVGAATGTYSVGLGRSGFNVDSASASQFAPQSYTYSYALTSGTRALASGASASAGSWTLNGTTINLQYVPVATDTNLQVFVSNTSASAGTLTFVAYNSASQTCTGDLGAVAASANSSFGTALRSALLGTPVAGTTTNCSTSFIGSAGRATVVLTSTTPSSGTRVHTGFSKSDGVSRQIVINSTN